MTTELKTPLYDLHLELGARMVPFAGYSMPVSYPLGVLKEHLHAREKAGLFDVSHMGQVILSGENAAKALEKLVPVDVMDLPVHQQRYAFFTNDQGGIMDDFMVTNVGDHLFVVVNAACKVQDIAHMKANLGEGVELIELTDRALFALQGPMARKVLSRLAPEAADMVFMSYKEFSIAGIDCWITCSGYTGEDGYEISVPANQAEKLARVLLAEEEVEAIGLGARDSLRLEAGLCLYGHDLDTETTPVESSLLWAISKVRRADGGRPGSFPGAAVILGQLSEGTTKKRVGLMGLEKTPVREGSLIKDADGKEIGHVTSGGFGPVIQKPIAFAYIDTAHTALGTQVFAEVRGKAIPMEVVKTPFVPQRYYRG